MPTLRLPEVVLLLDLGVQLPDWIFTDPVLWKGTLPWISVVPVPPVLRYSPALLKTDVPTT